MKVDGESRRHELALVSPSVPSIAADAFSASLQRHRRATGASREDSRSPATRSRESARPTTSGERKTLASSPKGPAVGEEEVPMRPGALEALPSVPGAQSPGETRMVTHLLVDPAIFAFRTAPRLSNNAAAATPNPCIEVTHTPSGARFLLSRGPDNTWLLAIASGMTSEVHSLVSKLNAQFASRGLGAIDVIVT